MKAFPLKNTCSKEDLLKYKGLNPQLFKDVDLLDVERETILKSIENSDKPSQFSSYVTALIFILFFIFWLLNWSNNMTESYTSFNKILLVGICFLLVILLKIIQPLRISAQAGSKMKKDWRKPIFFLRSFESDQQLIIEIPVPNLNLRKMAKHKFSAEVLINGYFSAYAPVVALSKPEEEIVYGVPNRIVVKDQSWKELVKVWLKISELVVMLVPENITDSINWEINIMKEYKPLDEILFFIPENISHESLELFLVTIKKNYNVDFEIDYTYINSFLVYNEERQCFVIMDYPKKYIKKLLKK